MLVVSYKRKDVYAYIVGSMNKNDNPHRVINEHPELKRRFQERLGVKYTSQDIYDLLKPNEGKCRSCNSPTVFNSIRRGYRTFCGYICSTNDPSVRQSIEDTHMQKRGVPHISMDFANKEKVKRTVSANNGGYTFQVSDLRAKVEATMMELYGVRHASQSVEIQETKRKNHRRNYGVDYPLQRASVFDKVQKSCFGAKPVQINAEVHVVRGYEDHVLKQIESKISKLETRGRKLPTIWYWLDGKRRRYYPDALVKTLAGNTVLLEVKGAYTLFIDVEKNEAKVQAALRWCKKNSAKFMICYVRNKQPGGTTFREIRSLADFYRLKESRGT